MSFFIFNAASARVSPPWAFEHRLTAKIAPMSSSRLSFLKSRPCSAIFRPIRSVNLDSLSFGTLPPSVCNFVLRMVGNAVRKSRSVMVSIVRKGAKVRNLFTDRIHFGGHWSIDRVSRGYKTSRHGGKRKRRRAPRGCKAAFTHITFAISLVRPKLRSLFELNGARRLV